MNVLIDCTTSCKTNGPINIKVNFFNRPLHFRIIFPTNFTVGCIGNVANDVAFKSFIIPPTRISIPMLQGDWRVSKLVEDW